MTSDKRKSKGTAQKVDTDRENREDLAKLARRIQRKYSYSKKTKGTKGEAEGAQHEKPARSKELLANETEFLSYVRQLSNDFSTLLRVLGLFDLEAGGSETRADYERMLATNPFIDEDIERMRRILMSPKKRPRKS